MLVVDVGTPRCLDEIGLRGAEPDRAVERLGAHREQPLTHLVVFRARAALHTRHPRTAR
ncbi:MAG: hypothetical protein NVV66_08245 [Cellulomonas sp.]|uniref:hypothetical protein n=1 Tax=Cellulomonas sp. TaxID=40001 RepID=UPI00258838EB|nr:hypothetical protein [Cellulomonas sp.]MCR6704673.1 hypothetical protein [Cellulomonas sp.]